MRDASLPARRSTRNGRKLTRANRERFLEALAAGWSVTHAAELAGFARQRFYQLRDEDEAFAEAWKEAWDQGTDRLEDELKRRAYDGYDESTYDGQDVLIRRVHRYDNTGLVKLLAARRPEKFRESATVEVQAPRVFVLESAFAGRDPIEVVEAAPAPPELLPGGRDDDDPPTSDEPV